MNLIAAESVDKFKQTVAYGYEEATGLTPEIYICTATEGVGEVNADF